GNLEKAISYYQKTLAMAQAQNNKKSEGVWLCNLGNAYADLKQTEIALDYYQKALAISNELEDKQAQSRDLGNLASLYQELGQFTIALEYFQQAIILAKEMADKLTENNILTNLGSTYLKLGQLETAKDYYQEALLLAKTIQNRRGEGNILGNLGAAHLSSGQLDIAIAYYQQALIIAQEIQDKRNEGIWLSSLGYALTIKTHYEDAINYLKKSIDLAFELDIASDLAYRHSLLARCYWLSGNIINAQSTIQIAQKYDSPTYNYLVSIWSGCIAYCGGQIDEAKINIEKGLTQAESAKQANQYDVLYNSGLAQVGLWLITGIVSYYENAIQLYTKSKVIAPQAGTLLENRQNLEALLRCGDKDGSVLVAMLQV
ncbi:MAG: tetratricopeptide repeat protein, partial [Anaerolineae bacterium]|nr:tetratricopeptide repeat protein [Anaerolineae bacterium]